MYKLSGNTIWFLTGFCWFSGVAVAEELSVRQGTETQVVTFAQTEVKLPFPSKDQDIEEVKQTSLVSLFPPGEPNHTKGIIKTNKHVYYAGEPLQIDLKIPSMFLKPEAIKKVDAYLLVYTPQGKVIATPIPLESSKNEQSFFEISTTRLFPKGHYDIAFVVTKPEGNPLVISDWYRGFAGLMSMTRIKISHQEPSSEFDEEDEEGDGEIDGDQDGDGYVDPIPCQ